MISSLREKLSQTLQATISKLGPVPDQHGDLIKRVLHEGRLSYVVAMGVALEDCSEAGNYKNLDPLKEAIEAHEIYEEVFKNGEKS